MIRLALLLALCFHPMLSEAGPQRVRFDSSVNWKFKKNKSLKAWLKTRDLLEAMLVEKYGKIETRHVENQDAAGVRRFISTLPDRNSVDLNFVYMACHQTRSGKWEFRDGSFSEFSKLQGKPNPATHRVLIIDACYAAAIRPNFAGLTVFAAGADEETFEFNVRAHQPLNLGKRYPQIVARIRKFFPSRFWSGKLSFFGFCLGASQISKDAKSWEKISQFSNQFSRETKSKEASRISVIAQ